MIASGALTLDDPAYFDRLARAESSHWWSLGLWTLATYWLDDTLQGRSQLSALDIGCGAGGTLRRLAHRPEIASVAGLDTSPAALARASAVSSLVLSGDARSLPFASDSFDLVTCLDVWQHLPPGSDVLSAREIHRVLRPHGLLLLRANGRGLWPSEGPPPYRLASLLQTLRSAGFSILRASYANCLPSLAQELMGRFRARSAHPSGGGLTLRVPSPAHNRLMSLVSGAEALVAGRLRLPLPIGHSTMALAAAS